ncbi:A-kinase anchor protein 9-like [Sceloporus undulatus]|uniref:A-kinase anchor protein 9-like n=1 Tax=Sceloporus undulatus TaxID=8520 RepID=UPI001C4AC85F|nr:A-kinase anchor protein 9-like [Sceloporus undulatus]
MFFTFGVIAIAAIVAIYVFSKENRNKNEYDNERPSLHSNCHCLGGTEEEAGTAPPCLDTSTRCKTKVTEEREGSTELPFKSTDMSQKILEELQSLKSQMSKKEDDTERDLKLEFRTVMKEMKQSVAQISTELKQINEKVQTLEEKTDKMDRARQRDLVPLALPEMRGNEVCLRFRAIPEQPNENIRGIIIEILTTFLQRQISEMDSEVGQVYRMNSSITTRKNLPRDVIVHFVRKQTRDQVLQQHYEITLKIAVKDMVVLKEIPERILHSRKEYGFLADKLKQKILFIMERSKEMTFTFEQSKFQVNYIQKAEEFLHKYKRELEETGELGEEESEATLEHKTNEEWKQGEDKDDEKKICSSVVDFTKLLA